MIERVRHNFLFEHVPEDAMHALLARDDVKSATFKNGETIYDPQHYRRSMGIILSGNVEVYNTADAHTVLLNILSTGQTFGVATLFHDAGFYISHIVSKGRCEVLFIPQKALCALFRDSMQAVENYVAFLSGRIYFLNRKIDSFTRDSAQQRLAMYLADAAVKGEQGYVVRMPFGMNKLATLLSIGRASLYRAMQSLVESGLIERKGRLIHIKDLHKLSIL